MNQNKVTCTKILRFSSGHRLFRHEGKCKFIHGHNYKAEITAMVKNIDNLGRVVDFSVIKEKIGGWIDENWDHKTLLYHGDITMRAALPFDHVFVCNYNPTVENMAKFLVKKGNEIMGELEKPVEISKVVLWETDTCFSMAIK